MGAAEREQHQRDLQLAAMASEAVSTSIHLPSRTLRAVPANSTSSPCQWIVGTTSLREENEVRVLEYDSAHDGLHTVATWVHPEEVWDVACCPAQPSTFVTVHSRVGVSGATLWQAGPSSTQLVAAAHLQHDGTVRRALWSHLDSSRVVTAEETTLRVWDVGGGTAQQVSAAQVLQGQDHFWTASLHPKHPSLALAAGGSSVQLWDLSTMSSTGGVSEAHKLPIRDVSWAPNNEYRFVTGGDDGKLRFWDTRLLDQPESLLDLSGHTHWVWQVAYSPFHDPLLLSSSTDTTVCVWYTPTLAKNKGAAVRAAATGKRQDSSDGKAHTFDDHEDSVYGLSWSAVDPWLFASMSYDGRLMVNRVPKNIKYRILI